MRAKWAAVVLGGLVGLATAWGAPGTEFEAKRYDVYLQALDTVLGGHDAAWFRNSVTTLAGVAVALDRTGGWDKPTGKAAVGFLADSPEAQRWFGALRSLLGGEAAAVDRFFDGTAPPVGDWEPLGTLLATHGYAMPAAAVRSYGLLASGGLPGIPNDTALRAGLTALASLTAADRDALVATLKPRLARQPLKLRFVSMACRELAAGSAGATAQALLAVNQAFNAPSADELLRQAASLGANGQLDAALDQALAGVKARPASPELLLKVLNSPGVNRPNAKLDELYTAARTAWGSPFVRPVRWLWLQRLAFLRPGEADAAAQAAGPLAVADLQLLRSMRAPKLLPSAAAGYATVARDAARPLGERLDALDGWLQSDPEAALATVDSLPWRPVEPRLVVWMLQRAQPLAAGWLPFRMPGQGSPPLAPALRQRLTGLATVTTRLAQLLAPAVLAQEQPRLRVELAAVAMLGGQPERAVELLRTAPSEQRAGWLRGVSDLLGSWPVSATELDDLRAKVLAAP